VEADSDGAPSAALPQRAAMGSVAVATDVTSTLLARAAREEAAVGSVPIPAPAIVAGAVGGRDSDDDEFQSAEEGEERELPPPPAAGPAPAPAPCVLQQQPEVVRTVRSSGAAATSCVLCCAVLCCAGLPACIPGIEASPGMMMMMMMHPTDRFMMAAHRGRALRRVQRGSVLRHASAAGAARAVEERDRGGRPAARLGRPQPGRAAAAALRGVRIYEPRGQAQGEVCARHPDSEPRRPGATQARRWPEEGCAGGGCGGCGADAAGCAQRGHGQGRAGEEGRPTRPPPLFQGHGGACMSQP
jgi:hypothetical protein